MGIFDRIFKKEEKNEEERLIPCRKPWYDKNSEHDRKVMLFDEPVDLIETDELEILEKLQHEKFVPLNSFIIYQQWGVIEGERAYFWLDQASAEKCGRILKNGPTRNLVFLCTMFQSGAIRKFAQELKGHNLDTLGLFWYFSGDDITDQPEIAQEIAEAVNTLEVKKLSIMTAEYNDETDKSLAENLGNCKSLENVKVFRKVDTHDWPEIDTPLLNDALKAT